MGLEDREWFQESRRERERLIAADAAKERVPPSTRQRTALDDLVDRHERSRGGQNLLATGAKMIGTLVVLCLAVFGALALVQHFAG